MEVRLILGDQLNAGHPWFKETHPKVLYLMMEMRQETDYVRHHAQKVLGFFAAMRRFAEHLESQGHAVRYLKINDAQNRQNLKENLETVIKAAKAKAWAYQAPDEYRLDQQLQEIAKHLALPYRMEDSHHFLTQRQDLAEHFKGKKTYLMESFYRAMRKKYGILMDPGQQPAGGKWNFDAQNRKKYQGSPSIPKPWVKNHNLEYLWKELEQAGIQTLGQPAAEAFPWPLDRQEALDQLNDFTERLLPWFGDFQDAMVRQTWTLWHSRLSFALNTKMLQPLEVIQAAEKAWRQNPEVYPLHAVEGFIRQILGWREYMRGIYWAHMPSYAQMNFFDHQNPLPAWFWTGKTKMRCLSEAIGQSLDKAYAHHIQRLMVTGAFGLMAGIHPDELDRWYLGIYIDAIEWVEITNTRGMSQFADGGIVGTKPYLGTAAYMHRMGDYCSSCPYDRNDKTGPNACPLNSLYWDFYARNRNKLHNNPRIGMMYRTWDKMPPDTQKEIRSRAAWLLEHMDKL